MKKKYLLCSFLFLLLNACVKKEMESLSIKSTEVSGQAVIEQALFDRNEGLLETYFAGQKISVQKTNGHYVWMGDIVFDQETFEQLASTGNPSARTFNNNGVEHWPMGIVPYVIDNESGYYTTQDVNRINAAINHWNTNTSLRFVPRTSSDVRYLRFRRPKTWLTLYPEAAGMWSNYIGRKLTGEENVIGLTSGVFSTGNVIHEIGHAIGFYHEHQRTDRASSIVVHTENIDGSVYNFQTYAEQNRSGTQIGSFDFESIMLYHSFAFSIRPEPVGALPALPTMTLTDGTTTFSSQRNGLSAGDLETASYIYGPPFGKIRYVTEDFYEDDQRTEVISNVYVDFYSDALCTIPTTLPANRNFYFVKHLNKYEYLGGANYTTNTVSPLQVTVSSGSSSAFVTQMRTSIEERDATWRTLYSENNWITGAFVR